MIKRIACILLCIGLLGAMYLSFHHNDYHTFTAPFVPMYLSDEALSYLEAHKEYTEEDVTEGRSTFEGVRYRTDPFTLYDTSYTLIYQYESNGVGEISFDLYDSERCNADSSDYLSLASQSLPPMDEHHVTVEVENEIERNGMCFEMSMSADAVIETKDFFLQTTAPYFSDALVKVLFIALVALVFGGCCLHLRATDVRIKNRVFVGICCLFGVLAGLPLLCTGLACTHDLYFHLSRIEGVRMSLQGGVFPIQINPFPVAQYGYPDPAFYPYFFLIFPALLRMVHVSPLLAYKAMLFLCTFLTSFIAGFVGLRLTKSRKMGLLFSVLYVFATYRLTNIFVRGALGEVLAFTFLPLAVYGLHSIFHDEKKSWLSLAIGMTCTINSHVLSVVILTIILALYALLHWKMLWKKEVLCPLVYAVLLTVGLCAFWVIPFLRWSSYGLLDIGNGLTNQAAHLSQVLHQFIFYPAGKSRPILSGTQYEMPISMGIVPLLGVIGYLCIRFYLPKEHFSKNKGLRTLCDFCFALFVGSVFLSCSSFPYYVLSKIPFLIGIETIQFPWRFLAYASFFGLLMIPLSLWVIMQNGKSSIVTLTVVSLVLLTLVGSLPLMETLISTKKTDYITTSMEMDRNSDSLYLSDAAKSQERLSMKPFLACDDDSVAFDNCKRDVITLSFDFHNPSAAAQVIDLPFLYYPTIFATLQDGKELAVQMDAFGNVQALLPEGITSGSITAGFRSYLSDTIACGVSVAMLVFCLVWWIKRKTVKKG